MPQTITKEEAKKIFGNSFFCDDSIFSALGVETRAPEDVPLRKDVAVCLASLGYDLFFIPKSSTVGISSALLMNIWERFCAENQLLYDYNDENKWYKKDTECFFYKEIVTPGWLCIKRTPLAGTDFSTYKKQTEYLVQYLEGKKNELAGMSLLEKDLQACKSSALEESGSLGLFLINKNYRTSFTEELFRAILFSHLKLPLPLESSYVWTNTVYNENEIIRIGSFDESGADITKRDVFDGNSLTELTSVFHFGFA